MPAASADVSPAASFAVSLLRAARTQGCERFQHQLLRSLLDRFGADHGAINTLHPAGFVASVGEGYDLAAMSAQWNAVGGAQLDRLTRRLHAQPGRALCVNEGSAERALDAAPWRDFLARHAIGHQMGVTLAFDGSDTVAHLYLNRNAVSPPYSAADVRALTRLAPALREALLVNRLAAAASHAPQEAGAALAVTDANGWILFANDGFCGAWDALAAHGRLTAPRVPSAWLHGTPPAVRQLGALGWQVSVARLGEHRRVAFRRLAAGDGLQALTARQLEVARLYCQGATHKHIGAQLGMSPATVRVHLRNAYERRGVSDRAALAASLGL